MMMVEVVRMMVLRGFEDDGGMMVVVEFVWMKMLLGGWWNGVG